MIQYLPDEHMKDKATPSTDTPDASWVQSLGAALQVGAQVSITLLIFLGIGVYVDKRWGTAPIFLLLGTVCGLIAVFFVFKKIIKQFSDR